MLREVGLLVRLEPMQEGVDLDDSSILPRERRFVVAVFPYVRSVAAIADLLGVLDLSDRWHCSHLVWRKHAQSDAALIRVRWRTGAGAWTSVMGLAPLGTMPVTRRSPFVALALWGGGFENPFRPQAKQHADVGLVDGVHGLEEEAHHGMWDKTKEEVGALLFDPSEDRGHLRQVAFVLPRESAHNLTFKDGTSLDRPAA